MGGIAEEWYQTPEAVTACFLVRGALGAEATLADDGRVACVAIALPGGAEHARVLRLHGAASTAETRCTAARVEVRLAKRDAGVSWPALECLPGDAGRPVADAADARPAYPTSARMRTDWGAVEREADAAEASSGGVEAFFQKLYAGADEDTRRAMAKSFVESRGTVLSTDWADVGGRRVDAKSPPGFDVSRRE